MDRIRISENAAKISFKEIYEKQKLYEYYLSVRHKTKRSFEIFIVHFTKIDVTVIIYQVFFNQL